MYLHSMYTTWYSCRILLPSFEYTGIKYHTIFKISIFQWSEEEKNCGDHFSVCIKVYKYHVYGNGIGTWLCACLNL